MPYVGKPSLSFEEKMANLVKNKFNVEICIIFTSFKIGGYFFLKCRTPFALNQELSINCQCLRNADNCYTGKSKRHLVTRVGKHLTFNKSGDQSAIYTHVKNCVDFKSIICSNFEILKRWSTDYGAILIKTHNPKLNKQLQYSDTTVLLQIF